MDSLGDNEWMLISFAVIMVLSSCRRRSVVFRRCMLKYLGVKYNICGPLSNDSAKEMCVQRVKGSNVVKCLQLLNQGKGYVCLLYYFFFQLFWRFENFQKKK